MLKWLAIAPVKVHGPEVDEIKTAFDSPFFQDFQLLARYFRKARQEPAKFNVHNPLPARLSKPKKGGKQPSLLEHIKDQSTEWFPIAIDWYEGVKYDLEIFSGISLWYTPGFSPVTLKWVVVRDPAGRLRTEAFFSTDLEASSEQILTWFILRWNIEVTFEELRAHLGVETQRQWSDLAITRTTPALFAMFSIVVLMALELLKSKPMPILKCAWYKKSDATFSDVIALVRRHIWYSRNYNNSSNTPDSTYLQDNLLETLLYLVCYAA